MNHQNQPLFFDIEADGFKETVTKIHCISATYGDEMLHWHTNNIQEGIQFLNNNHIVGHNIINYDIPVIRKFYPWFKPPKIDDTFILSSLFEPDRDGHGLADWGLKFGIPKPVHEDWSQYSEAMRHRNIEDVRITQRVWEHLSKERGSGWDWEPSIRLEYSIAEVHQQQESNGVGFDVDAAEKLYSKIDAEIADIEGTVIQQIPKIPTMYGTVPVNKPFLKDGKYSRSVLEWYPHLASEGHLHV